VESRIEWDATVQFERPDEPVTVRLVSLPDNGPQVLNKIYVRRGRLPGPYSTDSAIVSAAFAAANHLDPGREIRMIVNGKLLRLMVVGTALSPEYIFAFHGGTPLPDDQHFGIVWISERTLSEIMNMRGFWNSATLSIAPTAPENAIVRSIDEILARYGSEGTLRKSRQISNFFLEARLVQLRITGWVLPLIFLGVAAFLLHVAIGRIIS
jgi:putative ABC transport system permease protein